MHLAPVVEDYTSALATSPRLPRVVGPWAHVGQSGLEQGWKLHVSTIPTEATALLEVVLPVVQASGTAFKVARDETTLRRLNEGALGPTQIGKFVTVYPESPDAARVLAMRLADATRGFHGPVVVTDLRIGDVVYARYGPFQGSQIRDRLGNLTLGMRSPDGALTPHRYEVPLPDETIAASPFADMVVRGRDPSTGSLFGPGYLIVDVLKAGAKGSVFLAMDLRVPTEARLTVIKEGRAYCGADGHGRDVRDRLRVQARLSDLLHADVPTPAAGPSFEVAENAYLPLEFVPGRDLVQLARIPMRSLSDVASGRILATFKGAVLVAADIHERGYVHRDLTPTNLRAGDDGRTWILDLELMRELGSDVPPFTQGTPGYMSPQQASEGAPTVADDVYALGALAVFLSTGADPRRLVSHDRGLQPDALRRMSGLDRGLCDLIGRAVDPDPDRRPAVGDIADAIASATTAARPVATRPRARSLEPLLEKAAEGLMHAYPLDPASDLWLSLRSESLGSHDVADGLTMYRSMSRGVAGVVYALSRLSAAGFRPTGVTGRIESSVDWLLSHQPTGDDQLPGLHFGEAGVAVAITSAIAAGLLEAGDWYADYLREALSGPLDWPDITHGAAGQGLAALICADDTGLAGLTSIATSAADYLVGTQTTGGAWIVPDGVPGMSGTSMTGFAHGVAGCLYLLAEVGRRSGSQIYVDRALRAASWLERTLIRLPGSGLRWPTREGGDDVWEWWCHGGPGVALGLLKLYEATGAHQVRELADAALSGISAELPFSNLGQCHGLAGVGEVYLEAARVLSSDRWLGAAARVGEDLVALARPSGRGVTWLVEDHELATADLMIGGAGVVLFLLRLARGPGSMAPPLLPSPRA